MILEVLKQFNWVDVFVLLVLFRIIYIASKTGAIVELFKALGIIFATYVAFHYYTILSDLLRSRMPVEAFPLDFFDFVVFVPLLVLTYLTFVLFRNIICSYIKVETIPTLSKIGGFVIGIARGILTISLVIYMFAISCMPYLTTSAQKSYLGKRLFNVAVGTYTGLWDGLMSKFVPGEKINSAVSEIENKFINEAD